MSPRDTSSRRRGYVAESSQRPNVDHLKPPWRHPGERPFCLQLCLQRISTTISPRYIMETSLGDMGETSPRECRAQQSTHWRQHRDGEREFTGDILEMKTSQSQSPPGDNSETFLIQLRPLTQNLLMRLAGGLRCGGALRAQPPSPPVPLPSQPSKPSH